MKLAILFSLFAALPLAAAPPSKITVLVTSSSEVVTSASADGAATKVGGVVVGGASATASTYEHSELWEVVRRFTEGCPAANFVTNPQTPHALTIHTDYTKGHALMSGVVIYQLILLDRSNNPLYVSKKDWLRREVQPICSVIERQ